MAVDCGRRRFRGDEPFAGLPSTEERKREREREREETPFSS
jgi:hypothetical protein